MKTTKKQYDKVRDAILNKKNISELEKSDQLTNNWFGYIFNSGIQAQKNSLKYQSEAVRLRIQ